MFKVTEHRKMKNKKSIKIVKRVLSCQNLKLHTDKIQNLSFNFLKRYYKKFLLLIIFPDACLI